MKTKKLVQLDEEELAKFMAYTEYSPANWDDWTDAAMEADK